MKKTICLLLLLNVCVTIAFGQNTADKYIFPIKPGDKIWRDTRYPEKIRMLLIPDTTLIKLSNIQLIGACYEYPFWANIFAFNSTEAGLKNLRSIFNGYDELINRKNVAIDLIDFYSKMEAFKFSGKYSIYNESSDPLKFYLIEILLSNDHIINNLTIELEKKLYIALKEKYSMKSNSNIKSEGNQVFSSNSLFSTVTVMCKLALKQSQEKDEDIYLICRNILANKSHSSGDYAKIVEFLDSFYK